jgi:DNA polymerase-1
VFVGADYAQLEPRVFASLSGDATLQGGFERGEDFYSVVGAPVFDKDELSKFKNDLNSFAKLFPVLRDKSKVIALAIPYGRVAMQLAGALGISQDEAQDIINKYFETYPAVHKFQLGQHAQVKAEGVVYNLFGRPRRIPEAKHIGAMYGKNTPHAQLPYDARNLLNLAMNHPIQSTGASIMNRAAIAFYKMSRHLKDCRIISQVHDELIVECLIEDTEEVTALLKSAMEDTTTLPGVALVAEPKSAFNMADLK